MELVQGEVWRRSRMLVAFLIGELVEVDPDPVRLPDLIEAMESSIDDQGRPKWSRKTVENTVRDLAAFGALRISERGKDRVVTLTVMGLAWRAGIGLPPLSDWSDLEPAVQEVYEWFADPVPEEPTVEDWTRDLSPEEAKLAREIEHELGRTP